jgi:hypothetical protein
MNVTKNLKFRRQFFLSDHKATEVDNWNYLQIDIAEKKWFINYHPDLNFIYRKAKSKSIVLLGYILDPHNPSFDNDRIVSLLLSKDNLKEILECTNYYNGRFAILYFNKEDVYLFHDATGFREVYYTFGTNITACGSTPNIISEHLNIAKTHDPLINSFFNSRKFKENDNTWVGYKTMYENIMQLPPNHYLDFQTKQIVRYWPTGNLNKIDIDICARECADILKGTFASACNRYTLHMGITAGWDTRLLLAASKDFKDGIFYYVNKVASLPDSHMDIKIPLLLAKVLDLKLNIVDIPNEVDQDFKNHFFNNNVLAHDKFMSVFYAVFKNNWTNTYTVSGTMGNGLARIYLPLPKRINIDGHTLSKLVGYGDTDYVINELNIWCDQVIPICKEYALNIMDLYQMEQENTHWATLTSSEQDIVREEIRPFNNRRLIELFWSLDDKYRYQYHPKVYIRIMRLLWKKVLNIPVNPSFKSVLYFLLRSVGLERKTYHLFKNIKFQSNFR